MRSFTSLVAGLVACVVAVVTVPLLWVSTHVVDEDGYVSLSSALATDPELQEAFVAYLVDDYVRQGVLPEDLRGAATTALTAVTRLTTNQPGFTTAWEKTQLSLHRSAFAEGDAPLSFDLQPLAAFAVERVEQKLPVSLPAPTTLDVVIGTADDHQHVKQLEKTRTYSLVGLMVVLASIGVSVISARSRGVAIAGLGIGALAVAGVLRVLTEIVTPQLVDRASDATTFGQALQKLLATRASESLAGWLGWIAIAGVAAVVVGAVGRLITGRPAPRG